MINQTQEPLLLSNAALDDIAGGSSDISELVASSEESSVLFQRNNLGLFTLDIGTTENLDVN